MIPSAREILRAAARLGLKVPWWMVAKFVARVVQKLLEGKPLWEAILEAASEMLW